jgi:hypothetical protein
MSLQAPTVVVADQRNDVLATALRAHDGAPLVECTWQQAADCIGKSWPSAVIFDDPVTEPRAAFVDAIAQALKLRPEPYLPVLSRVAPGFAPVTPNAIPVSAGANADRIAARLASAMRVRTAVKPRVPPAPISRRCRTAIRSTMRPCWSRGAGGPIRNLQRLSVNVSG